MISVIVPCYNTSKKYLSKCLESIANQTNKEFECIIVDDCSSSLTTTKFLKKWVSQNKNFKLIVNKNNCGLGLTRNIGFEHSTGEIIVYVDSDDYLSFDALEDIKNVFNSYESIDFYWFSFYYVSQQHGLVFDKKWPNLDSPIKLENFNYVLSLSKMAWLKAYKREFLLDNKINFINKKMYSEDTYYNAVCLSKTKSFIIKDKKNYYYNSNVENSITSTQFSVEKANDLLDNFIEAYSFIKNDNSYLSKNYLTFFKTNFFAELKQFNVFRGNEKFEEVFLKVDSFVSLLEK